MQCIGQHMAVCAQPVPRTAPQCLTLACAGCIAISVDLTELTEDTRAGSESPVHFSRESLTICGISVSLAVHCGFFFPESALVSGRPGDVPDCDNLPSPSCPPTNGRETGRQWRREVSLEDWSSCRENCLVRTLARGTGVQGLLAISGYS